VSGAPRLRGHITGALAPFRYHAGTGADLVVESLAIEERAIHPAANSSSLPGAHMAEVTANSGAGCLRRNASWRGVELASETVVGLTRSPNPFEVALTVEELSPFSQPTPIIEVRTDPDATFDDSAPSRQALLQRAAALGPSRMTWESIVLPADPILGEKMQPRVRERRARFRKLVKVGLGACVAFCLFATAATALSSANPNESAASTASVTKTAPAIAIVPIEKLEQATRTKATSHMGVVTAAARPAPAPKAWGAKRH
jgi:hypothetical protein